MLGLMVPPTLLALADEASQARSGACMDYRWVNFHVAQIAAQAMAIRPP